MPANLALTLTQNLRTSYKNKLDKNENRASVYGGLNMFKKQTSVDDGIFTEEELTTISNSFDNSVQIPVMNHENITIGNVRTCNVQTGGPTSQLVTLTFITYSFGFDMFPAQHFNNDAKYEQVFNKALSNRLKALANTIDTQCIAVLETNKNQFWPANVLAFYPQVGDALQVPQAEKEDFYNQWGSITQTMDFVETPDVALNHVGMSLVRRLAAQGEGNSVNEGFQLLGYTWYPTNRVTNNLGVEQTVYGVIPGSLAMVPRLDPDVLMGHSIGTQKQWSKVHVPILDIDMGVYYQEDCADGSTLNAGAGSAGKTRTKQQSFEYSIDICFRTPYNSAPLTQHQPIVKAEILA